MSNQVIWSKLILETFIEEGNLTEWEEEVMRTRTAGWTRRKQCDYFNVSESTLDRTIRRLKKKYDDVSKYNPILPPRKFSAQELYMDEN